MRTFRLSILVLASMSPACSCSDPSPPAADASPDAALPPPIIGVVPETGTVDMPGLGARAYVIYTEHHVPHVYAETREDAARVLAYVTARDRYFVMDMARRLALGTLSGLLGQDALSTDQESVGSGMRRVVTGTLALLTPEQQAIFDAYAEGVNAYIDAVRTRREFAPRELSLAAPLLGARSAADMMAPFARQDIVGILTTVTYELGYETKDPGRETAADAIATLYTGEALEALRTAGAWDVYSRVTNSNGYASASIWGLEMGTAAPIVVPPPRFVPPTSRFPRVHRPALDRLKRRLARIQRRLGRDMDAGFGSNAWAVSGALTTDGAAILEGDGHLGGSVPTLFYRMAIDTQLLGGGTTRQVGLAFPGLPMMAVGTNGSVAWSQTQAFGDITDWYREEITLDAAGLPTASMFQGSSRPLVRVDEAYDIADVVALGSVGRMETWPRFETFDGRLITSIEGRLAAPGDTLAAGESLVNVLGDYIVPADMDMDGVITAVSFDYAAIDGTNYAKTIDTWGHATTVRAMYDAARGLVGYSQNIIAADADGSVLFLPYQAVPCRDYLARNADRTWATGADPGRLLDGTRFGAFEIPVTADGTVDEAAGVGAPERCVVPLDAYPAAINPTSGFVVSANNDPGTMAQDNSLTNDPWYIGGPWHEDFRATRIAELITAAGGTIDEDGVAQMQADHRSPLGAWFVPYLLESIAAARTAAAGAPVAGSSEARLAARWAAASADYTALETRIAAWRDGGLLTQSGVETFYNTPTPVDQQNAVATMLFNAWLGAFHTGVIGDERFPGGIFTPTGSGGTARTLTRLVAGRGPGNPLGMPSYNTATEESAFFDVLGTPEVETSQEIAILAIDRALTFLRSAPTGPGAGGFGNDTWDEWLWGLRHHKRFDSLLGDVIGAAAGSLSSLVAMFEITPATLPLFDPLPPGDPRIDLPGFPRGGDNFVVDAANPGFGGTRFTFGGLPVFRMVIAPRRDMTTGRNILPGGQSSQPTSDFFSDQLRLWLENRTSPMYLTPEQVVPAATDRETFIPAG